MLDACDYLKSAGLDYMVKSAYSWQTLRSYVTEVLSEGHDLPDQFENNFNVITEDTIGLRRS
jgi:hypothetical protein